MEVPAVRKTPRKMVTTPAPSGDGSRRATASDVSRRLIDHLTVDRLLRLQRDLATSLASTSDLPKALNLLLTAGLSIPSIDCGGVYLLARGSGDMDLLEHAGLSSAGVKRVSHCDAGSRRVRLAMVGKPFYESHAYVCRNWSTADCREHIRAMAVIPIRHRASVIGTLNLGSHTHDEIPPPVRPAIESLAALAGAVLVRVQTEQALRENEERYRVLVESAGHGVALWGANNRVLYMNPVAARFNGSEPAELVGRSMRDLYPRDARRYERRNLCIVRSGVGESYEDCVELPGGPRWFWSILDPVKDARGKVVAVQIVSYDITKRKAAEDAIRSSREQLQHIVNSTQDVIFQMDLLGNFTFSNPSATKMTGYTMAELMKMNMRQLAAPEYHAMLQDRMVRRRRSKPLTEPFRFEIRRKRGGTATVELRTTPMRSEGRLIGIQGLARDVTARDLAERRVRESEARYRLLADQSFDSVVICRLGGRILDVNRRAENMFGYSRNELLEMRPEDMIEERDLKARPIAWARIKTGESTRRLRTLRRKEGSLLTAEVRAERMPDGRILVVLRDVTEQRRLQRDVADVEIRERRRTGQDLHDSLGQYLTGIALMTEAMAKRLARQSSPEAEETAQIARFVRETMAQVRRIARGLAPVGLQEEGLSVALKQLADDVSHMFKVSCRFQSGLSVSVYDHEVATHLYHIAREAVTNAIRHAHASRISVRLEADGGQGLLTVRANGKAVGKSLHSGDGLGLRIMRYRSDLVGGTLRFTRGRGGGLQVACSFRNDPGRVEHHEGNDRGA